MAESEPDRREDATAANRTLPAIVWDMGGILYRYFTETVLDMAAERGADLEGVPMGPTGSVPDDDYAAMDRGDIKEPEYLTIIRQRLAGTDVDLDPVADIDWEGEYRETVWGAVLSAHEHGHPQAVLTNDASRWLGDRWWEAWEPASWFDVIIDVATLDASKPAPEPYLEATRRLGVDPEDCLFVDDLTVNCKGAEAVGMASVWFDVTDPHESVREVLERAGLL